MHLEYTHIYTIKKWQSKNSKTIYLKTIIAKLDLSRKTVIIDEKSKEKKNLLATKSLEKMFDASHAKKYHNSFSKSNKQLVNHCLKKNYSATKN